MNKAIYPNRTKLFFSLNTLLRQLIRHEIELFRISRTVSLMLLGGLSPNSVPEIICERVLKEQRPDGGWVGPDDSMWIVLFLKLIGMGNSNCCISGINYLKNNKQENCWGRSSRDIPRIPVTGRILFFLPELNTKENLENLLFLWQKEKNSLTYKAAFTIMACSKAQVPCSNDLIHSAATWLQNQQNDDGGFGPWKNHPAGSDIFCTSVAMLALAQNDSIPNVANTLSKAFTWMSKSQLPNGLWPYHQIEDGASWAFFALDYINGLNLV